MSSLTLYRNQFLNLFWYISKILQKTLDLYPVLLRGKAILNCLFGILEKKVFLGCILSPVPIFKVSGAHRW
ncbi:MAG: hypothetical protein ACI8RA_001566 [Chlamydiales bacterium]|jgi:hypothetical protein